METKYVSNKRVDDYEHEGDLRRELETLKRLGIKVIDVEPGDEDDASPTIYYEILVNKENIQSILDKAKIQIERAKIGCDYSHCMHPYELQYILKEIDKKCGTEYYKTHKEFIDGLINIFND